MDYDRILTQFLRIVGISAEGFDGRELIEHSRSVIAARLKKDESLLTAEERSRCEYAAAACGAYEYISQRCLRNIPVMSENGVVAVQPFYGAEQMKAAREVKRRAIDMLCELGLADRGDFLFTAV